MKSATRLGLMCLVFGLSVIQGMPIEDSEVKRASRPPIGETIQQLTNQLIELNGTMPNTTITLDTRTPPRVKQQMKNHQKVQSMIEHSHPGMAIPADESEFELHLEESTKKSNIYRLEYKSTTEKGLSTWVLLNSQTVSPSTQKVTVKPIIKLTTKINEKTSIATSTESSHKPIKPFFKKRPVTTTTTRKPATTTKMVLPVTKIKFSVLQGSKNKTQTTATSSTKSSTSSTTTLVTNSPSTRVKISTTANKNSTQFISEISSTTALPAEAKDAEVELTTTATDKKNKKNPPKKKKNKNRRRRPSGEKSGNSTEISDKIGHNNSKPIGTQIYNYLSREIMPTVGVGLVGLMVTAGLASYFFNPFATLRRSYEIDRKDVKGSYYYDNDYSVGGVAEEDMISKVIAGMSDNQGIDMLVEKDNYYFSNKNNEKNEKASVPTENDRHKGYRNTIDAYVPQSSYSHLNDDGKLQPKLSEVSNSIYNNNKQFVVGAITKHFLEVTPAAVPEHGPRSLKKRSVNDIDNELQNYHTNEIFSDENVKKTENTNEMDSTTEIFRTETTSEPSSNKDAPSSVTSTESSSLPPCSSTKNTDIYKPTDTSSIIEVLKDLIDMKIRLGLEVMKNTTMSISRYFHEVQKRFESRRRRH